jgi:hypothetical protein
MIRAATAHGKHEARIGKADADWPDWYAEYMCGSRPGKNCPNETTMNEPQAEGV